MKAFRITKSIHARDLSGKGAEMFGGRWNSIGVPILYASSYAALCILEHLVHLPKGSVLVGYQLITLEFPDNLSTETVSPSILPAGWKNNPPESFTQAIGDQFIFGSKALMLKVPFVLVPTDFNLLFNPRHRDFGSVKIISVEAFVYDERLLQ